MIAVGLLAVLLAACGPATDPSDSSEAIVPEVPAPTIRPMDASTLAETLSSAEGGITVVNFWATWCVPCAAEMPELVSFYDKLPDGATFYSVSIDHPTKIEDAVRPFLADHEIPFDVIVLDAMPDELIEAIDVGDFSGAVPATFVYGRDGGLVKAWYEEVTASILLDAVKPLL